MKALLKKIIEITEKNLGMFTEFHPVKYQQMYEAYIAELEKAIQEYTISNCDCPEDETTGTMTEEVCNICGRVEK